MARAERMTRFALRAISTMSRVLFAPALAGIVLVGAAFVLIATARV